MGWLDWVIEIVKSSCHRISLGSRLDEKRTNHHRDLSSPAPSPPENNSRMGLPNLL